MVAKSFFMTWHMQQDERLKMMTGCSDISLLIRVSVDSSSSMESPPLMVVVLMGLLLDEEEEGGVGGSGVRSSCTTSLEQLLKLCIAREKQESFCVIVLMSTRKASGMRVKYKTERRREK